MKADNFQDVVNILEDERQHRAPSYGSLVQSIFGEADRMERKDIEDVVEDRERKFNDALIGWYQSTEE